MNREHLQTEKACLKTGWIVYIRERVPLTTYGFLGGGISLSGRCLGGEIPVLWSFVGSVLFLSILRIMDDVKDVVKDRIAHPERPLVRGVVTIAQVSQAVTGLLLAMLCYACVLLMVSPMAGMSYAVVTACAWLMYREFFISAWLSQRPLLYALTHQGVCLAVAAFATTMTGIVALYFGLILLGAFFCYEVCRKFDPEAHPLLNTYRLVYGTTLSCLIVMVAMAVAAIGAWGLGMAWFFWPLEVMVAVGVPVLSVLWPKTGKPAEILATLSLALHAWLIPALDIKKVLL